jgi:hypothetical protein
VRRALRIEARQRHRRGACSRHFSHFWGAQG